MKRREKCCTPLDVWNKVQGGKDGISPAETAICLRATLAREFPSVKFSVTSKTYSMGSSISVHWTDGPATKEVQAIAGRFSFKGVDGSIDLAYYKSRWLSRDGSMSLAKSGDTTGSMGSQEEVIGDPHAPDAVLVRGGAGYIHINRHLSEYTKLTLARRILDYYHVEMPVTIPDGFNLDRWMDGVYCGGERLNTLVYQASEGKRL